MEGLSVSHLLVAPVTNISNGKILQPSLAPWIQTRYYCHLVSHAELTSMQHPG